jgi:hypothetical protein
MTANGAKATTGVEAGGRRSEVNLLGNIQGVVHLNSEISDGAFQLGVSEEKLDCLGKRYREPVVRSIGSQASTEFLDCSEISN